MPADALNAPTPNPAWNLRELLVHIILAPEMLPQDVKMIRRGLSVPVPAEVFNQFNKVNTRRRALGMTLSEIGRQYDVAHQNVLALLETLNPSDLALTARYPILNSQMPGGEQSIADLFRYVTLHFAEHAVDVLRGVETWRQQPLLVRVGDGQPPQGWRRLLFRMPIWLYRNNLGWVLGGRFLLINQVGRKSGLPRQTVVEVVDRDRAQDVFTVASGWGEKADWYKNLRAHPQTTIQIGQRILAVTAHFLSADESGEAMVKYAARHPALARELAMLMGYKVKDSAEGYRALGRNVVRFVRFLPVA